MMNKKSFWLIVLFALLMSNRQYANARQSNTPKKPNIIFILTDDLGYGDLGVFYQQRRAKANNKSEPWMFTPNLDRLAAEGAQFTHQYSAAPVCAPSRASLMLGQSQGHANVRDNQFDKALEDNYTMACVLRQAGYATAIVGKWGLQGAKKWEKDGDSWPAHPLNRGFDYFFGYMRHSDGHEHYPKEGLYRESKEVWDGRKNITDQLDKCYTADLWTAAAKKWIIEHERHAGDQPFFLYLAYDTPHAVLELPTQAYPKGGGLNGGLQWIGEPGHMINTASGTPDSWTHPDYAQAVYDDDHDPATPGVAWPRVYQRYATAVRRVDSGVGDIMTLLKDLQLDSNTLIVFTSDNGPSIESYLPKNYAPNHPTFFNSFGPFDGIKRDSWEGGVRMPSIIRWPEQIAQGKVVTMPSTLYDWLPTFTEAAGLPAPARVDGVSLLPVLTGKGKQQESLVYSEYYEGGTTPSFKEFDPQHRNRRRNQMQLIRMGNYVGVRYDIQSADDDFELYDVVNDPQQTKNLAVGGHMADLQGQMKEKVLQVRRPDTAARRPYDDALVPAIDKQQAAPGLAWKAYTNTAPWISQVSNLFVTAKGEAANLDAGLTAGKELIVLEGYLKIPTDGTYHFYLDSPGKSILRLHQALLIDEDYGYKSGDVRQASVRLKAGLHPFTYYYQPTAGTGTGIHWQWEGPHIAKQDIPAEVFYH
ncbi:sulfatase-like hydrolase/transferase [Olivibacter ginsenosidimutans]